MLIEEMKPDCLAPEKRNDESILACALDMAVDLEPEVFARQSGALRSGPTTAIRCAPPVSRPW